MALSVATLSCVIALVVGLVWARRRRQGAGGPSRQALILALTGLVGLVALDVGPRQLVDRTVDACGLEGLDVRLASVPVAWQLATGGLRGEVRVPSDIVTDRVVDRMRERPLVAPRVTLTDDAVEVDAIVQAPMGRVPVTIVVDVSIDNGELVITPGEVLVAGRLVSDGRLGGLAIDGGLRGSGVSRSGSGVSRGCADSDSGTQPRLTGVDVEPDGLVLGVAL